jgi:hypothetical protein
MTAESLTAPAEGRPTFWANLRKTLGPPLVGWVGGAAGAALLALGQGNIDVLSSNVAGAYDQFPDSQRSWLAVAYDIPGPLAALLAVLAFVVPLSIGLFVARLTRVQDWWSGLSTAITTAAFAVLGGIMFGFGWASTMLLVMVPSLGDYQFLITAAAPPPAAHAKQDPRLAFGSNEHLKTTYAGLQQLPQEERAQSILRKIIADQVTRSAEAPWVAFLLALMMPGCMAFAGTLAGTFLVRRGDRFLAGLWPHVELTVPGWIVLTMLIGLVCKQAAASYLRNGTPLASVALPANSVLWTLVLTAFVYLAVVQRWSFFPRFMLEVSWSLVVLHNLTSPHPPTVLVALCHAGTAYFVVRQLAARWRRPATQPATT